jgi:mRNA interferase RelE/StbE
MASFNLQWRSSTKKDLRKLPSREVERILAEVEPLAEEPFPHGCEKLGGAEHTYRIRIGDYRVIFEVFTQSRIVEIQRVRHRKDVYRQ